MNLQACNTRMLIIFHSAIPALFIYWLVTQNLDLATYLRNVIRLMRFKTSGIRLDEFFSTLIIRFHPVSLLSHLDPPSHVI